MNWNRSLLEVVNVRDQSCNQLMHKAMNKGSIGCMWLRTVYILWEARSSSKMRSALWGNIDLCVVKEVSCSKFLWLLAKFS